MSNFDIEYEAGKGLKEKLIEEARALLKKHGLASVKIFATYNSDDARTFGVDAGAGNYYANLGQCVLWVEGERQKERREADSE